MCTKVDAYLKSAATVRKFRGQVVTATGAQASDDSDVSYLAGDDNEGEELLPRTIEWAAATSARIAIVDQALAVRMAQWPEIFAALMDRAARRAERLVVTQAIAHLTRVDDRLLALLWLLAERWGRVVPGGVLVSLRLPHRTLAGIVGARRPSVTTALGQLMARGAIERRADGAWILRGSPPSEDHIESAAVPFAQQRVGIPG